MKITVFQYISEYVDVFHQIDHKNEAK